MELTNTERGIPSGFPSLDRITGGWQNSNLIVIASRPSVGKTTFALNVARNAAVEHNIPVAFFSLEMSSAQLSRRLIMQETGLSKEDYLGHWEIDTTNWQQLEGRLEKLSKALLYVDDTPGLSLKDFREKVKELVEEKNVRLIVVDYLQLMQGPEEYRGQREQEVAYIARALKSTAKEMNVPVIGLSQLSRTALSARTGRPELKDIRESVSIEETADLVILIHRPDIVAAIEDPSDRERAEFIIAKNLNGNLGEVPMLFKAEKLQFEEAYKPFKQEPVQAAPRIKIHRRLNEQYTLDTFKLAPSNIEAIKVAMDFICNLSNSQQFLLIGPTGSGKTRLINVVGNAIEPDMTVLYVTGKEFEDQYKEAVKKDHLMDFRNFYAKADVMLLDDLQDLVAPEAQKALGDIRYHLYRSGKRIGVTSSLDINDLEKLFDKNTLWDMRMGRVVKIEKFEG